MGIAMIMRAVLMLGGIVAADIRTSVPRAIGKESRSLRATRKPDAIFLFYSTTSKR
jgi:hypothetical protein